VSAPLRLEAGLGVDGDLEVSGAVAAVSATVAGAVRAGAEAAAFAGDLAIQRGWEGAGPLRVEGDLRVGGRLAASRLEVGGVLRQPAGAERVVSGPESIGREASGPVAVAPPCRCSALPDPAERVQALAGAPVATPDTRGGMTVGCAPRVLDVAAVGDALRVRADGAGVLVVDGRLALGTLVVRGGGLDLFVAGHVLIEDTLRVEGPGRLRLFVGGRGTLRLPPRVEGPLEVFAPFAELVAAEGLRVTGSLVVRRVAAVGLEVLGPR
jgi:hypothetical protein